MRTATPDPYGYYQQKHSRRGRGVCILERAKQRAIKKNITFNLRLEDLPPLPTYCPILGIPLYFSDEHETDNSPSLDRVDNTLGYIKGNVKIISNAANRFKGSFTIDILEKILQYMKQHSKEKDSNLGVL